MAFSLISTPNSYRPLDPRLLQAFQDQWNKVWFIQEVYRFELGSNWLTNESNQGQSVWYGRANWFTHLMTGTSYAVQGVPTVLVRALIASAARVDLATMLETAFELMGKQVHVIQDGPARFSAYPIMAFERGQDALQEFGIEEEVAATPARLYPDLSGEDFVHTGTSVNVTRFLEMIPPVDYRLGDLLQLEAPRVATFANVVESVVEGLHAPGICQLCDRVRIRVAGRSLTDNDREVVLVLHTMGRNSSSN